MTANYFECSHCGGRWPIGNMFQRYDDDGQSYYLCETCDEALDEDDDRDDNIGV